MKAASRTGRTPASARARSRLRANRHDSWKRKDPVTSDRLRGVSLRVRLRRVGPRVQGPGAHCDRLHGPRGTRARYHGPIAQRLESGSPVPIGAAFRDPNALLVAPVELQRCSQLEKDHRADRRHEGRGHQELHRRVRAHGEEQPSEQAQRGRPEPASDGTESAPTGVAGDAARELEAEATEGRHARVFANGALAIRQIGSTWESAVGRRPTPTARAGACDARARARGRA